MISPAGFLATLRRLCCFALLLGLSVSAAAERIPDPQKLVADAWVSLGRFLDDPQQGRFRNLMPKAKAILIVPRLVRAGLVVGGTDGAGVVLARQPRGDGWSQPAFYSLSGVSLGLQAGADVSEAIFLILTQDGFDTFLGSGIKLGGEVSVAAGPTGEGAGATVNADVFSFARGKGLYAGVVGKGMLVEPDSQAVRLYFGADASPEEILVKKKVYNRDASKLITLVSQAAKSAGGKAK